MYILLSNFPSLSLSERMSGSIYAYFLTLFLAIGVCTESTGALAAPKPPTNVRLNSYNMNLVLSWDPPLGAPRGLLYTAEYKSTQSNYRTGCVNISNHTCDFSSDAINVFGTYTSRVQAHYGVGSSNWEQSNSITLDKETLIGPPNVSLTPIGATLEVYIEDPVLRISNLRNVFHLASYNVTYWKYGQDTKAKTKNESLNRIILTDLIPQSQYCLQVQINTDRNVNPAKPSNITCESTQHGKDEAPWLTAVWVMAAVVVALPVIVLTVVYRKRIQNLFCPKSKLAEHLKVFLLTPDTTCIALPPVELYDTASIIAADKTTTECGSPTGIGVNPSTEQSQVLVVNGQKKEGTPKL